MDESEFTCCGHSELYHAKHNVFTEKGSPALADCFPQFFLSVLLNKRARSTTIIGGKRCNAGSLPHRSSILLRSESSKWEALHCLMNWKHV